MKALTVCLFAILWALCCAGVCQQRILRLGGRPLVHILSGETEDMRYVSGLLAGQRIQSIVHHEIFVRDLDQKAALKLIKADKRGRSILSRYEDSIRKSPRPDIDIDPWGGSFDRRIVRS